MPEYERLPLDSRGINYVKTQLEGGNQLARACLATCKFDDAFTIMPKGHWVGDLLAFSAGGKLPAGRLSSSSRTVVSIPNTDLALSMEIKNALEREERGICIIENPLSRADDPDIADSRRVMSLRGEAYHFVVKPLLADDEVLSTLKDAKTTLEIVGFLAKHPRSLKPELGRLEISDEDITEIARTVSLVFASAYDGESYVLAHCRR